MQRKSFVTLAALMLGLALGIIFRPSLAGLNANAQTTTPPAQSPVPSPTPAQAQPKPSSDMLRNLFLDQLAARLNIQRSALDSAISSAGNSTADAAVQQGTLTQAQADALKARIQAGDLGALWGGRGGHGGKQLAGVHQAMFDAAAQALNLTTAELITQLRSGQTLAQLAQANNTTEQAVTSAALAAAKTQLDQAVANGTLTQAQADTVYAELQQRGLQLKGPRGRGPGGRGLWGVPAAPATPGAPATPQPSDTNL
jgi:hypothetical protein